jgi:hypothetical protein
MVGMVLLARQAGSSAVCGKTGGTVWGGRIRSGFNFGHSPIQNAYLPAVNIAAE